MMDLAYDPELRRDTPLALKLKQRIRTKGPITIAQYMQACLQDHQHGYYRSRPAIGRTGDFVTAPEISQVFGELIGLWCAVVWQQMGSPSPFNLVELGPGRGVLMADALRAARRVPGFIDAAELRLVESNEALQTMQRAKLAPLLSRITWHAHEADIVPGPSIVVANEFLDVLPAAQFEKVNVGWMQRGVTLDAQGRFQFTCLEHEPLLFLHLARADETKVPNQGSVVERRHTLDHSFGAQHLATGGPLAVLFIDYGHLGSRVGDTLQAVRAHRYEHPLTSPGEADLTAHVDFESFADEMKTWQFAVDGPLTQAEFLGALGAIERTSRLMAANPGKAAEIEEGIARLLAPNGMGTRFKAIGFRSPSMPTLPGFPVDTGPSVT